MGSCLGQRSRRGHFTRLRGGSSEDDRDLAPFEPPPSYEASTSDHRRSLMRMSEDERLAYVKRLTLIQLLPASVLTDSKQMDSKKNECVICMLDFVKGDPIRVLPCMHSYHAACIDDWLERALTCPTCMIDLEKMLKDTYGGPF